MNSAMVSVSPSSPSLNLAILTIAVVAVPIGASVGGALPQGSAVHPSMNVSVSNPYNSTISVEERDGLRMGNSQLEKNLQKLAVFGAFEKNWNGYGAEPFTPDVLDTVRDVLLHLDRQPQIYPVDSNVVQLEYEKDSSNEYLEFELSSADSAAVFMIGADGEERDFAIERNISAINEVVGSFYGQ